MNIRVLFGAVASALLIPSIALAEFTYTGVEVAYVDVEFNNGVAALNGDGYRVGGFYEFSDSFFLLAELEDQSFDLGIDGTTTEVGVGFHHAFGSTLDFVGSASLVSEEVQLAGFGGDDDGFALGGGIRTQLTDSFQIDAGVQWVDLDRGGSDTRIKLRGRYYFTDSLAFSLETDFDDDIDTLSFGFRAEF